MIFSISTGNGPEMNKIESKLKKYKQTRYNSNFLAGPILNCPVQIRGKLIPKLNLFYKTI